MIRKGFLVGRWKSWISRYGILRRTDLTFPSAVYLLVGFFWLYMVISLQKMDYYGRKDIPEARKFRPDGMCERYHVFNQYGVLFNKFCILVLRK